ncbi:MAG TPA: SCO family protein [Oligoflexia bacterium]|nr:SCO family protein [Oligoflexia bacterium]HMP47245.1 SCO family protein [Oligoflexia bacterium]
MMIFLSLLQRKRPLITNFLKSHLFILKLVLSGIFFLSPCLSIAEKGILRNLYEAPAFRGISDKGLKWESENILPGNIILVNFFFTSCHGPCPALMDRVRLILKKSDCKILTAVSISVDNDNDTPERLASYRQEREFDDPRWTLLNAEEDHVMSLLNEGFKLGTGGDKINHSTRLVLIDQSNRIRSLISGNEDDAIDSLVSGIMELCK